MIDSSLLELQLEILKQEREIARREYERKVQELETANLKTELAKEKARVATLRRVIQEEVVKQSFNSALLVALGSLLQKAGVQAQIGDSIDLVDKMRFLGSMVDRLKQALQDTE